MKYYKIAKDDMRNGTGLRVTLFVSGCGHDCRGCKDPRVQDPGEGFEFTTHELYQIEKQLEKDYIAGCTFKGGDPLFLTNRAEITMLCQFLKQEYSQKTIWLYTGYKYEEVKHFPVMRFIDVLVDGKYEEDLADAQGYYIDSSNQRLIDVPNSLRTRHTILYKI